MARLIDADDFLKRLNERPIDYLDPGCDFYYLEETVESVLNETPTVDVGPVVHGMWIDEYPFVRCSVCNAEWLNVITDNDPKLFYYCPNCGAVMDLEEESDA